MPKKNTRERKDPTKPTRRDTTRYNRANTVTNFYMKVITASSVKDVARMVPFHINAIVTKDWIKAGSPTTANRLKSFCINYLYKKTGFEEDFGFAIIMEHPQNVRTFKEKFKITRTSAPKKVGRTEVEKCLVLYDENGRELKVLSGCTWKQAKEVAMEICNDLGFYGNEIECVVEYRFIDRCKRSEFTLTRKRAPNQVDGKYIVFGVHSML